MLILTDLAALPSAAQNTMLLIGNFDGLHLGHQALIAAARQAAKRAGCPLTLMTFAPHPRQFFKPDSLPQRLMNDAARNHKLEMLGIDYLIIHPFDETLARLSEKDFVEQILVKDLQINGLVVGENFRFGHQRHGDILRLQDYAKKFGFAMRVVPSMKTPDGMVYSSSRIREALKAGDIKLAEELLGRLWEIEGVVQHGDARARDLGFPTANIDLGGYQRPRYGVYAVKVLIDHHPVHSWLPAVANIGVRPTFGQEKREWLEVHIPHFDGDLYGKILHTQLLHFIRPEKRFANIQDLKAQMGADIDQALRLLS